MRLHQQRKEERNMKPMKQKTEEVDHPVCIRCNRKLKSPEARLRGMGDVCWKKYQQEQAKKKLF